MKISASVFSNPDRNLEDLVLELEDCGVDYIHIDCKDDPSVGEAIGRIRKVSSLPIDLHLISPHPESYYDMIREHKVEMVTLQVEDLNGRVPDMSGVECSFGLALMTDTPLEAFSPFAEKADFILFMTTVPGESGGTFRSANFTRIQQFRKAYPRKRIHVDGGVNAEISFVLRNMGVFCAVSGSFLVKANSVPKAFLNLLVQKSDNHLLVKDIMFGLEDLPVLELPQPDLGSVLEAIEQYRMGYCLFRHPDGQLAGIVTNADLRRAMLAQLGNLNAITPANALNPEPKRISASKTVSEMLKYVKSLDFLVLNLPVVDGQGKLVGAVNFNNLILGEL